MVNLIRSSDSEGESIAQFYTVETTGESGTNQTGLSVLCGVSQQAISDLEKTLTSRSPSEWLESFIGKDLTLTSSKKESDLTVNGKPAGNLTIYQKFGLKTPSF